MGRRDGIIAGCAQVAGCADIGEGAFCKEGTIVGPGATIGDKAILEKGAKIGPISIVGNSSIIGSMAKMERMSCVAEHGNLGANATMGELSVVEPFVHVPARLKIRPKQIVIYAPETSELLQILRARHYSERLAIFCAHFVVRHFLISHLLLCGCTIVSTEQLMNWSPNAIKGKL